MRVQIIAPHFDPDVAATGVMMTGIAKGLAEAGHELHVVTSLPFYRNNEVEPEWRGKWVQPVDVDWGRITRVQPFPMEKSSLAKRALGFAGFTGLASVVAMADRWRPDVVLAMSPPITLGLAGWLAARRRRVPFVFNVQDIFPDVTVELGLLTNRRAIAFFSALEKFLYARADAVTVLSNDMAANVAAKLDGDITRVRVIPNFVDHEWITPGPRENPYRDEFGLAGKTVVMYSGNVGFSQPLHMVIDAARALADRDDVVFVINGDGAARAELQRRADGVDNVRFVGMQPGTRMPEVYAAADVHLVPLREGLSRCSVPSKFYAILAAERPAVVSIDAGSELHRVLDEVPAGLAVGAEDTAGFIDAIRSLIDDPDRAAEMGRVGRRWVTEWASPASIGERYGELFAELTDAKARG